MNDVEQIDLDLDDADDLTDLLNRLDREASASNKHGCRCWIDEWSITISRANLRAEDPGLSAVLNSLTDYLVRRLVHPDQDGLVVIKVQHYVWINECCLIQLSDPKIGQQAT